MEPEYINIELKQTKMPPSIEHGLRTGWIVTYNNQTVLVSADEELAEQVYNNLVRIFKGPLL